VPENPEEPSDGLLGRAVQTWQRELAGIAGSDDLLALDEASPALLDLGTAHPSGLAGFLAGRLTRLSELFREAGALAAARERARTIRTAASRLTDEHGLPGSQLAVGVLTWPEPPGGLAVTAPVLLRPLTLVPHGAADYDLAPGAKARLNPALRRLLAAHGIRFEVPDLGAGSDQTVVARQVLDRLRAAVRGLDGARVQERTLVGTFVEVGAALLADLELRTDDLGEHSTIRGLLTGEPSAHAGRPPGARSPRRERLDLSQRAVVDAVAAGADLRVEAPPGTGATEVAACIVEDGLAAGRSLLVVSPRRGELGRLRDRLSEAVVLPDLAGAAAAHAELHRIQHPWKLSRMQVLQRLVELGAAPQPGVVVRSELGPSTLRELASGREPAAELLAEAADVDAYDEVSRTSPWAGAPLTVDEHAAQALAAVRRLLEEELPAAQELLGRVLSGVGLPSGHNVVEWGRQLDLLVSVRSTLGTFLPAVYERDTSRIVQATASGQWREDNGVKMSLLERRRWRKEGAELVRPGMRSPDLHTALVRARNERDEWRRMSGESSIPATSPALAEADAACQRVVADLQLLEPTLAGTALVGTALAGTQGASPLDELDLVQLAERLRALAAASEDLKVLPRRNAVLAELRAVGLEQFVERLRDQGVQREVVADELEIAWHRGVLEEMDADHRGWDPALRAPGTTQGTGASTAEDGRLCLVTALAVAGQATPAGGFDTVLLLDAHRTGLAESVLAIARGRQGVVVGNPDGLPPVGVDLGDGSSVRATPSRTSLFDATQGRMSSLSLERAHRQPRSVVELAAALSRRESVPRSVSAPLERSVQLVEVQDGTVPVTQDLTDAVPDAEVQRVVELVLEHVATTPEESLAVLTVTRAHARAVADVLRQQLRRHPELTAWLTRSDAEPFVVTDLWHADDAVRDRVVLALGFALTPHGRVLHRFGPLDAPHGGRLLGLGVSRARRRLTVVSCLRADQLDAEKLSTDGARTLLTLLERAGTGQIGTDVEVTVPDVEVTVPDVEVTVPDVDVPSDPVLARLVNRLREGGHQVDVAPPYDSDDAPDLVIRPAEAGEQVAVLWDGTAGSSSSQARVARQFLLESALQRFGWRVARLSAERTARDLEGAMAWVLGSTEDAHDQAEGARRVEAGRDVVDLSTSAGSGLSAMP